MLIFLFVKQKMSKMIIFLKILIFLTKRHTFTNLYITPHFYTKKLIFVIFVERLWDFVSYYFPEEEQRLHLVDEPFVYTTLRRVIYLYDLCEFSTHIAQIRIKMCKSHNIHTFQCGGCEILCITLFRKRNKVETSSPK